MELENEDLVFYSDEKSMVRSFMDKALTKLRKSTIETALKNRVAFAVLQWREIKQHEDYLDALARGVLRKEDNVVDQALTEVKNAMDLLRCWETPYTKLLLENVQKEIDGNEEVFSIALSSDKQQNTGVYEDLIHYQNEQTTSALTNKHVGK